MHPHLLLGAAATQNTFEKLWAGDVSPAGTKRFLPGTKVFSKCRRNECHWRGRSAALGEPRGGSLRWAESTVHNPGAERGLCRALVLRACLAACCVHFSPGLNSTRLRRVPEPGFLWTHCRPHWSAPEASPQLLTGCQTQQAAPATRAGRVPGSVPSLHSWGRMSQQCLVSSALGGT